MSAAPSGPCLAKETLKPWSPNHKPCTPFISKPYIYIYISVLKWCPQVIPAILPEDQCANEAPDTDMLGHFDGRDDIERLVLGSSAPKETQSAK